MAERRLARIPDGPSPGGGVAGAMPGAGGAARRVQGVTSLPRVRLSMATPGVERRVGGVTQDGGALAQGETAAARASAIKGQALGRAISDAGAAIGEISQRVILARESAELMEADAITKRAYGDFMAGLPDDPYDWEESRTKMVQQVKRDVLAKTKMRGAGKKNLEANLDAWDAESATRLSSMSIQRHAQIAKVKSQYAFEQAVEREDTDGIAEILGGSVQAGIMTSEEASIKMAEALKSVSRSQFGRLIEEQPFEAEKLDLTQIPWMTSDDRLKAKKSIRYAQAQARAEEADGIANALAKRPDMPESDFRAMLAQSHLEPVTAKKFEAQWKDDSPPDFKKLGALRADILKLSRSSDWEEVMKMRERIASETRSSDRGMFMQYLNGSISDGNQDPLFGEASNLINATVDQYMPTGEAFDRAEVKVVLEAEFFDWRAQNPEATREQSLQFLKTLGVELDSGRGVENIRKPGLFFPPPKEVAIPTKQAEARNLGFQRPAAFFQKILSSAPPENTYQ